MITFELCPESSVPIGYRDEAPVRSPVEARLALLEALSDYVVSTPSADLPLDAVEALVGSLPALKD